MIFVTAEPLEPVPRPVPVGCAYTNSELKSFVQSSNLKTKSANTSVAAMAKAAVFQTPLLYPIINAPRFQGDQFDCRCVDADNGKPMKSWNMRRTKTYRQNKIRPTAR